MGAALALALTPSSATAVEIACAGSDGDETALIAAIEAANAGADHTIELAPGCVYALAVPYDSGSTIYDHWYGPSALPAIASAITIEGNGAVIERAADAIAPFRLLFVGADPAEPNTFGYATPGAGALTLRDVTLRGGLARGGDSGLGGSGAGLGGAIFNQGVVQLDRVTLASNTARGGSSTVGIGSNGGGVGSDAGFAGGGFGDGFTGGGGEGGAGSTDGGGGGGGGFRAIEDGLPALALTGGSGGGPTTGTGGAGTPGGAGGDGSGGGGDADSLAVGAGGAGGSFGHGGSPGLGPVSGGGGGGGVGGGGGASGGSGGFGGGGASGGSGGFGGGGGDGSGAGGFGGGNGGSGAGGGGAGMGGAIFNHQGMVSIVNSTLSANTAVGGTGANAGVGLGGALFNLNGSVSADSATIAGNGGGGIYNLGYLGDDPGDPGGHAYVASTVLTNSILADATGGADVVSNAPANVAGGGPNTAASSVIAADHDLVESGTGTILGSPLTADPTLGALADNGGLTPTHAITEDSPAFDSGATALVADQRGITRPQGPADDIGAFELQAVTQASITTQASADVTIGGSVSDTATVTGSSPTGKVTFSLYGPDDVDCSGTATFTSEVDLPAGADDSKTISSGSSTPTLVGTYRWRASYSGDPNNDGAVTACDDPAEDVVVTPLPNAQCGDGVDNGDADTLVDFPADPGCSSATDNSEVDGQCDDGVDNGDADTLADFPADAGCSSFADDNETGQCEDGVDNGDADTLADFPADPGCVSLADNDESSECEDGIDNDSNSRTDFSQDLGCSSAADASEASPVACPANVNGTGGNDTFVGRAGPDRFSGLGGDDFLSGQGGDDCLLGGHGGDVALGGDGSDLLDGGAGSDRLVGDIGNDVIYGAGGGDQVEGGDGADLINPETGADTVLAQAGNDTVVARDGNKDTIDCGSGNADMVIADAGDSVTQCENVVRP